MKELRDDRVHAWMAIVRELFGLEADQAMPEEANEPAPPLAEVRELRSSRR
jgi:hypothetical protein